MLARQQDQREAAPVFVPACMADIDVAAVLAEIDALGLDDDDSPEAGDPPQQFRKIPHADPPTLSDALQCGFNDLPAVPPISADHAPSVRIEDRSASISHPSLITHASPANPFSDKRHDADAHHSHPPPSFSPHPVSPARPRSVAETLAEIRSVRARYSPGAERRAKQLATKKANREKAEAEAARRTPPPWKRADEFTRLPFYGDAILKTGRAVAFTLNVSPVVLKAGEASEGGVLDYVRRRITRRLTGLLKGSLAIVVCLDADEDGRLHVHGLIDWPSGDLQALASALRLAGGEWLNKSGKRHQVRLQDDQCQLIGADFFPIQKPLNAGWLSYSAKHAKRLKKLGGRKAIYASSDVKKAAEAAYDARKAERRIGASYRPNGLTASQR